MKVLFYYKLERMCLSQYHHRWILSAYPQGQSPSLLTSFSSYSTREQERVVSVIRQILFVMDILLVLKFSSIFKVKSIFSSHLETI